MGKKNRRPRDETTQPASSAPTSTAAAATTTATTTTTTDTANDPANFPNTRPQLRFSLADARKSNVNPRDVSTLVSQVLLPFEHPNYPTLEQSQRWFQLQHARTAPACVVIGVPGLPLEALVATEYLQPERVDPQAEAKKDQQQSADDDKKKKDTTPADDAAAAAKDTNNNTNSDDDDAAVFKGAFPPNFNPWLKHVRALPHVSCCRLWLPSTFMDANLASEFFFRNKAGGTSSSGGGNKNNNNNVSLASTLAVVKQQDAAAASATEQKQEDDDKDKAVEAAPLVRTLPMALHLGISDQELLQMWDPSHPSSLLQQLALDAAALKLLDFPYEADSGEGSYPVARDYGLLGAGGPGAGQILNFDTPDGESANANCPAAKAFLLNDDDEVNVNQKEEQQQQEQQVVVSSPAAASGVKPLPQYRRLWAHEKQAAALGCLRSALAGSSNPSSSSSDLLDDKLVSDIQALAAQLKLDIELTKQQEEKKRIPVLLSDLFKNDNSNSSPVALALDCEMIQTQLWGSTLSRLTLVECPTGTILCDVLVRPDNAVADYVTRYSGISATDLDGIQLTIEGCQLLLQCLASRDRTFFVGHSLENDFIVARVLAEPHRVLDTGGSLFPSPRGLPYRNSLKYLAHNFLSGRQIQTGAQGHDSAEDARTAMDLVTLKLKKGEQFGLPNRVNVLTWWNGSSSMRSSNSSNPIPQTADGPRVFAHLVDRRSVLQKVSVSDTNAIHSSNDGTTSHRAQKLLQKVSAHQRAAAVVTESATDQQTTNTTNNSNIKNFVWTQLYDAALNENSGDEQQKKQQQQPPAEEKKTDADTTATAPVEAAEAEDEDLGKMLKEHVVAVHRRLHRIINAAPDGSVILIMVGAHQNGTITIQQAHPAAHGMLFGFVKDSSCSVLPEGDDMFDKV